MEVFEAIAQPKRREILRLLASGERSAGEVAARFDVTQPAVSQHLKVLKTAGLVADRQVGTRRIYEVDRDGLAGVRAYFDRFWREAMTGFKETVERKHEDLA